MADPVYQGNNQTNTATAVPKAGGDNHIPIKDSAAKDWKAITSENFLEGPQPGQEQELIKSGDQSAKIAKGRSLAEVQKKSWTHVYDDEDHNVVLECEQTRTTTVIKNDNLTVGLDQKVEVCKNQEVKVTEARKVSAKNIEERATLVFKAIAGTELILEGPGGNMIKIDASGVTIQGVLVKIN